MSRNFSNFIFAASVLPCLFLIRCGSSTYFASPITSDPAASAVSCSSKVIDRGVKTNQWSRGLSSDVKITPGTSYPAVAFSDSGSLVLKFSYWTGSHYDTEVVAGDYSVNGIRLIFLSTGVPWIFWSSSSGLLKAAVRSAPVTSSGTWSTGVIDVGTSINAFEAAVNPLDQIGIIQISDSAVTGRPKFLYCKTCNSIADFSAMDSTNYIENTNVIANEVAVGLAWCKASATVYYPAVTYAVTGATQYGVCRQSDLANCKSTSSWSTQTVVASGNTSMKIVLDTTVTGDVPKIATQGGAGVTLYKMGATACTSAPAAFAAGSTIGSSTTGDKSMTLLVDSSGKYHLVANESTTNIRYYNSQSTNFTGAWNGWGNIQTATIGAPAWIGADIDNNSHGIFASYGITSTNDDLRLAKVTDYRIASDQIPMYLVYAQPDGGGNIQASDTPKRNISMASTSAGVPAAAYVDYSTSSASLKYAVRLGNSADSSWTSCGIPYAVAAQSPNLIFDGHDRPWVSFFDTNVNRFYLATSYSATCGGTWFVYEFPHVPSGAQAAFPASNDAAVARYGLTDDIIMVVLDTNATSKGVYGARLTTSTGSWSVRATVANLGNSTGGSIDASSDINGNVVALFHDLSLAKAVYSVSSNGIGWSTPAGISALNQGMGGRIRIHPKTGQPIATYFDRSSNAVYYNICRNSPQDCANSGWTPYLIDSLAGVSGLTNRYDLLLSASLTFSDDGVPYVIYPRGKSADGNLVATGVSSSGNVTSIMAYGKNANFADTPALNYAVSGWGVASTRNAAGYFTSVHLGPGNWLYATSCND